MECVSVRLHYSCVYYSCSTVLYYSCVVLVRRHATRTKPSGVAESVEELQDGNLGLYGMVGMPA